MGVRPDPALAAEAKAECVKIATTAPRIGLTDAEIVASHREPGMWCSTNPQSPCVLCWRSERDAMGERLRAVPFYAGTGYRDVHLSEDWATPDCATGPARTYEATVSGVPMHWSAPWLAERVEALPDLHPLPKFTVPGDTVDYSNSALQKLIEAENYAFAVLPMPRVTAPTILAAEPGSCRACGLASCMHPRS
jgi:hypothetical protein